MTGLPPFCKVGYFDFYKDDPWLGMPKVALCKYTALQVTCWC